MSKYSALIVFHRKSDNSITTSTHINVTLTLILVGRHTWEPETQKTQENKGRVIFFKDLHTWIVQLPESPSARTTPIHWFSAPAAPLPMMTALRTTHEIPLSNISGIPVTLPGGSGSLIDLISNPLSLSFPPPYILFKSLPSTENSDWIQLFGFCSSLFLLPSTPLLHLTLHEYSIEENPSKP
jgi:hypothetical protein